MLPTDWRVHMYSKADLVILPRHWFIIFWDVCKFCLALEKRKQANDNGTNTENHLTKPQVCQTQKANNLKHNQWSQDVNKTGRPQLKKCNHIIMSLCPSVCWSKCPPPHPNLTNSPSQHPLLHLSYHTLLSANLRQLNKLRHEYTNFNSWKLDVRKQYLPINRLQYKISRPMGTKPRNR